MTKPKLTLSRRPPAAFKSRAAAKPRGETKPRVEIKPRIDIKPKAEPTPPPRRPRRAEGPREIKYYGTAACLALWKQRPHDVIRIYLEEARIPAFTPMLKWAAAQRKAYHIVTAQDLEKLTESVHHQGVCVLAREAVPLGFAEFMQQLRADDGPQLLVYLDGVENPHNLGAILRSCAHFGVRHVLGAAGRLPALSPSACRVAEGGAEHVALVYLDEPQARLRDLKKAGFKVIAASVSKGKPLFEFAFPPRSLLVLGAEMEGVSAVLGRLADHTVSIPGSGAVESLNVSVAGAVIMGEYCRQQR